MDVPLKHNDSRCAEGTKNPFSRESSKNVQNHVLNYAKMSISTLVNITP